MDKDAICQQLPTECPSYVQGYTYEKYLQELGGHLAIYKRVSYQAGPELMPLMCPDDFDNVPPPTWAAECTCTCCQESWHTAWSGGPMKAIVIMVGEDGIYYPVTNLEDADVAPYLIELTHNDGILCPCCGENLTLTHVSKIKSGTTRRVAMCSIDNIGKYSALLYWLAYRHIDSDGLVYEEISPWYAFLIDEKGKLVCFRYSRSGWKPSTNREDPFWKLYISGDGGCYNQKRGGYVCETVPSLIGTTGEKTGLAAYVSHGGQLPLLYLKTWQQKPAIENLVNQGWTALVESMFNKTIDWSRRPEPSVPELNQINWCSSKPHEMLFMSRPAYRRLNREDNERRTLLWYDAWRAYRAAGGQLDVVQYDEFWCSLTSYGMDTAIDLMHMLPGLDLPRLGKYFAKQNIRPDELHLLRDTWRITSVLTGRDELTYEERWPRNLIEKHDQLAAMYGAEKNKKADAMYLDGFIRIAQKYGCLHWSDGEFDIILPKHNGELVREGAVLRHCVGTYGAAHVSETETIFFVRRHRRPDRPYYTLSMNMLGEPKRKQLHGYGNERHGEHKQFSHSIPSKVRRFCARWEREVVMPWYRDQQRKLAERMGEAV